MQPPVFDFSHCSDYLKALCLTSQPNGRKRSLTYWSRRLGYRSPRSVAMVIKGQRPATPGMIRAVSKVARLTSNERRYLELLSQRERLALRGGSDELLEREIAALLPGRPKRVLTRPLTEHLARWHHLVIKQLIASPSFREDPRWIQKRLRAKISTLQIRRSIENLLKLEIIEREPASGKLVLKEKSPVFTSIDIPVEAIRSHHREMMQRACEALEEQPVEEREMCTLTTRVRPERVAEAKKAIREFRDWFDKTFESPESDAVYQLNVQFFQHTAQHTQGTALP